MTAKKIESCPVPDTDSFKRWASLRVIVWSIPLCHVLLLPVAASAHHGIEDDIDRSGGVKLEGMIEQVEWINPHVIVHLSTTGGDGLNQQWQVLIDSPNTLLRRGVNRNAFPSMSTVSLRVYPSTSVPCAASCLAYGYELSDPRGNAVILHQVLYEIVNQLNYPL